MVNTDLATHLHTTAERIAQSQAPKRELAAVVEVTRSKVGESWNADPSHPKRYHHIFCDLRVIPCSTLTGMELGDLSQSANGFDSVNYRLLLPGVPTKVPTVAPPAFRSLVARQQSRFVECDRAVCRPRLRIPR